jgi:hypothetical protein
MSRLQRLALLLLDVLLIELCPAEHRACSTCGRIRRPQR